MPNKDQETLFSVPKMDCPSEERLIRMALSSVENITSLSFDLQQRQVTAVHSVDPNLLLEHLSPLKLGAIVLSNREITIEDASLKSIFSIPKMDCPSEENLIRMALANVPDIQSLSFDIPGREMTSVHRGSPSFLLGKLEPLNFGVQLKESTKTTSVVGNQTDDAAEAKTLRQLLVINAAMFFAEIAVGITAQSTGLIADSLDMFADAAVYGLALYAVGRAAQMKSRAAHLAGWLQLVLALGALSEVLRRFFVGSEPQSTLMIAMGVIALIANVACLVLISSKRENGAHMKASYIFSANDVIANLGVIVAGILVTLTGSSYPDLIIGTMIGVIVLNGAFRILRLR